MRRFLISFVSIILLYVLQCSLFQQYLVLGFVAPNLILMFACIVGFMRGRTSGMFTGFFGGLLVDIMAGGNIIGICALLYMFAGFFNGLFHREYEKEQLLLPLSLVALCDFIFGFLYYCISFLLRNNLNLPWYLSRIILPEVVYTTFVSIFAYLIVYFINNQLKLTEKKRLTRNAARTNS